LEEEEEDSDDVSTLIDGDIEGVRKGEAACARS
jgi:hypothetical protein